MKTYASFSYYQKQYSGVEIKKEDFPRLASRASAYIYNYTRGISDKVTDPGSVEQIKLCTCAIAEVCQYEGTMTANAFAAGGVKTSETVGPWSQGFSSGLTTASVEYLDKRKRDLLELYLSNLPEFSALFKVTAYRCTHDARRGRPM